MTTFEAFMQNLEIPRLPCHALHHALQLDMPSGIAIEVGVWNGSTINKIAKSRHFNDKRVYGFDSFEGLPETWDRNDSPYAKGHFNLQGQLPSVPENVELVKGWFCDTLPVFAASHQEDKIALLHIDCDLYSSTVDTFKNLKQMFQDNMIIVFDELINYPGYERHEILAFYEFLQTNPQWKVEWIGCVGLFRRSNPSDKGPSDQSVACRLLKSGGI
jgi:hypothetical protein